MIRLPYQPTLKYYFGNAVKTLPLLDYDIVLDLTNISENRFLRYFNYGSTDKYDTGNLQFYDRRCVNLTKTGLNLRYAAMDQKDQEKVYQQYLKDCASWKMPVVKKTPWLYMSGAVHMKGYLDVNVPGSLYVFSNLPQNQVGPGIWLYDAWNEDHKNTKRPGRKLFEADLAESGPNQLQSKRCVFCSMHDGLSYAERKLTTERVYGRFRDLHLFGLSWDGRGNFDFSVDAIVVMRVFVELHPLTRPTVKLTYGITPAIPNQKYEISKDPFVIQTIAFKGNWVEEKYW